MDRRVSVVMPSNVRVKSVTFPDLVLQQAGSGLVRGGRVGGDDDRRVLVESKVPGRDFDVLLGWRVDG
jgi:hypothetical protein